MLDQYNFSPSMLAEAVLLLTYREMPGSKLVVFLTFPRKYQGSKKKKKMMKAIPVIVRGGPSFPRKSAQSWRVSLSALRAGRPFFTPQENSWYPFLLEYDSTPGPQCGWKDYYYMAVQSFVWPWPLFQFLDPIHSWGGGTRWTGNQSRGKAATYTQDNTSNKRTETSMLRVAFEPTIPSFERAKKVHALDRAATVKNYLIGAVPPAFRRHALPLTPFQFIILSSFYCSISSLKC
jgi:hypothetical protein